MWGGKGPFQDVFPSHSSVLEVSLSAQELGVEMEREHIRFNLADHSLPPKTTLAWLGGREPSRPKRYLFLLIKVYLTYMFQVYNIMIHIYLYIF